MYENENEYENVLAMGLVDENDDDDYSFLLFIVKFGVEVGGYSGDYHNFAVLAVET